LKESEIMLKLVIRLVLSALALVLIAKLVHGIHVTFTSALVAAVVLGILNAVLRPIFVILTLPITLITFGLFIFVINAILFLLAALVVPGFVVHGFLAALLGSILYAVAGMVVHAITGVGGTLVPGRK
jgi:putative membrane protein